MVFFSIFAKMIDYISENRRYKIGKAIGEETHHSAEFLEIRRCVINSFFYIGNCIKHRPNEYEFYLNENDVEPVMKVNLIGTSISAVFINDWFYDIVQKECKQTWSREHPLMVNTLKVLNLDIIDYIKTIFTVHFKSGELDYLSEMLMEQKTFDFMVERYNSARSMFSFEQYKHNMNLANKDNGYGNIKKTFKGMDYKILPISLYSDNRVL